MSMLLSNLDFFFLSLGTMFRADVQRNKRCYGPDPHAHQVLGGEVEPRHELDDLIEDLRVASRAAFAALFEPSYLGSEISELEEGDGEE